MMRSPIMENTATPIQVLLASSILMILILPMAPFTGHFPTDQAIPSVDEPLSIILMIGDGMGYEHVELARLVEVGEYGSLTMQQLMCNASVMTTNSLGQVTDSAAAGTALATGNKTTNARVGQLPDRTQLENIVEFAQSLNKSTGIVSTREIVDATPATFTTHVSDRHDYTEIARQLVEDANLDLILGGGNNRFSSAQKSTMVSNGFALVYNRSSMLGVISGRIMGLFASYDMPYEIDRNYTSTPSIAEMINKSLELLSQDPDGFFLMVEGGLIDVAAHAANKVNDALETIEFDRAVKVALDYVEAHTNTILIVTADHETMGLVVNSHDLSSELPSSLLTLEENETLRIARASNITVTWTATYHTDWPVPIFCYGSTFTGLQNDSTIDNTNVFVLMKNYFLGNPLSTSTTTATTTSTTTGTSTTTTTVETTNITTTSVSATSTGAFDMTLFVAATGAAIIVLIVVFLIRRK
jgi:alkaline phosphatase